MMHRIPVRSRDIAIIGYDPDTRKMEVAFKTGSVYEYEEVPPEVYDDFIKAESQGCFFKDFVRNQFKAHQVTGKKLI